MVSAHTHIYDWYYRIYAVIFTLTAYKSSDKIVETYVMNV